MVQSDIVRVLRVLKHDKTLWAITPCGHEYKLADSELFYGDRLPPAARPFLEEQRANIDAYKQKVHDLQLKLTTGFTKKSVEVKLGKTVEKICPVLPGFPYSPLDCRALFDPIDYLAFVGASKGTVSKLDFVDVKTGHARLNIVQRQIRDAVDDGEVELRRVGP